MIPYPFLHALRITFTIGVIAFCLLGIGSGAAIGHGGKTHAEEPFSALQAVQKAIPLYDRLVVSGKLPESWETDLSSIHVDIRETGNQREYVVRFQRKTGEPQNVYFFFDREGEYSGSNYTGK